MNIDYQNWLSSIWKFKTICTRKINETFSILICREGLQKTQTIILCNLTEYICQVKLTSNLILRWLCMLSLRHLTMLKNKQINAEKQREWIWRQNNPNIVVVVAITASVNMQGHLYKFNCSVPCFQTRGFSRDMFCKFLTNRKQTWIWTRW